MSTESVEQIKQQISELSAKEKAELRRFLSLAEPQSSEVVVTGDAASIQPAGRRGLRQAWIAAHQHEVGGRYVALDGDRLLGTASSYPEALAVARRAGVDDVYVDYIPAPDEAGFVPGWE